MYQFALPSLGAGKGLKFDGAPVAGTVSGLDATFVMLAVQRAIRGGSVTGHPWSTKYKVNDPLHAL